MLENGLFGTDSSHYEVLEQAVSNIKEIPGLCIEIGIRLGGSSKIIIDGLIKSNKQRTFIGLDPYGSLPYLYQENNIIERGWYHTLERDITIPGLFLYCAGTNVNFIYQQMTDDQYMKRFSDGIPVCLNGKENIENQYALVFFDGPHTLETVMNETLFFSKRSITGTRFVYDDIIDEYYDHTKIRKYLLENNWEIEIESRAKKCYIKIR